MTKKKSASSRSKSTQEASENINHLEESLKGAKGRIAELEVGRAQSDQKLKEQGLELDKAQRELAQERQLRESLQSQVAELGKEIQSLGKEIQSQRDRIVSDGKQIERYPQELAKTKLDTKQDIFRELCGSIGPTALGALSDPHAISAVVFDGADADRIARRMIGYLAKESVSLINRTGDRVILTNETDLMRFKLLDTTYVPNLEMIVAIPGVAWQGRPLIKAQVQSLEKTEEKAAEKTSDDAEVSGESSESEG